MSDPETRASLLLRIRDPRDGDAWDQFASLYCPVVLRLAQHRGMQPADADDLAQQVLIAVAGAIDRFEPDADRGKFRTWLRTIARNAIINALARQVPDRAAGGSDMIDLLCQLPDSDEITRTLTLDYRRQIFHVAAEQISGEFEPTTWQAFWDTVVLGKSVSQVAVSMKRSTGSVYTARSRVMSRLKQKVQELDVRESGSGEPSC